MTRLRNALTKNKGRARRSRWTPISTLALPALLLLAVDGTTTGVAASIPGADLPERTAKAVTSINKIDSLSIAEHDDGTTTLRLRGSEKPTFNVYRLSNPDRLVVNVSSGERGKVVPHVPVDTWAVGQVAVTTVDDADARTARVVVNLKRESSYIVVPKGTNLLVTVTPKEVPPEAYFARKSAGTRRAEIESLKTSADNHARSAEDRARKAETRAKVAAKEAEVAEKRAAEVRSSAKRLRDTARIEAEKAAKGAENRMKEAETKAKQAEQRANSADQRAKAAEARAGKAASAAVLAETRAAKVEKDAEGVRLEAKAMLAKANEAMGRAESDGQQAKQARKAAEKHLAEARKAQRTQGRKGGKQAAELQRAVEQAKAAEKAARGRQAETEKRLAQLKADRARLEKALSARDARDAQLSSRVKAREAEFAKLEGQVESARKRYEKLGGEASAEAVKRARAETVRMQAAHSVLEKEVQRLRKSAAESNAAAKRAEAKLAQMTNTGADAKEIARGKAEAKKHRESARSSKVSLRERSNRLDELGKQLTSSKARVAKLAAQSKELESQGASLRRKNRAAKAELENAETQLAKLQASIEGQRGKLDAIQSKVAGAEKRLAKTLQAENKNRSLSDQWKKDRKAAGNARVRDVRFEDAPGEARVVIEVDGPLVYDSSSLTPQLAMLKLPGTAIPEALERSLDTSSYNGPVGMISSFREGGDVKIIVASQNGGKQKLEVDEKSGTLVWRFPRKSGRGRSEVVSLGGNKVSGFASAPVPLARKGYGSRSKWRGERIDIELQDAPIKDVLLLFSDIGRVNIVAGQGVQGTVTMKLSSVPWDQALDIILRSLELGMEAEGNVIRVAPISTLEEERRKRIEKAASEVQLRPLETELVPLSYATVNEMLPKVQSVLSSRGTVTPDTRTNTLIIMDVAENIALAKSLVGSLDSQTPQVLIEARIVEARTNWLRNLGIQWGFDYIQSPGTGNPTGLLFPNSMGVAGGSGSNQSVTNGLILPGSAANPNYAVDLPAPVGTGAGGAVGFSFGNISGTLNTNLRLSAAEDEGEVRIISAPKVVTLDNTQAQIEQGVQIPISQVSAQGVNTRYVNATLALRVTPHVTNEGSVLLDVQVQKNEADFVNTGARGDPTILTKNAQSQMLITDGDTAVIGGIYTRNQSVNRKKVPWVADIPIIGWFFKNKSEGDTRTEVLIFMTPKIINRTTSIGEG